MTQLAKHLSLSACALAAAMMISACGGGSATPPYGSDGGGQGGGGQGGGGDTTPPSLSVTDDVLDDVAKGDVTFTFTFSEDIGTSFNADDITVAGGSKGVFTAVSATSYTLVVTPNPNATGMIEVSVAAGAYADLANNANTAVSSAQQAYDTVVDTTPPTLAITDDVAGDIATGDVTFTFTFSEDVGTSFTADDVVVTGGTKGALFRANPTTATMIVSPNVNVTGTIVVSVAAGTYSDAAGNLNTVPASDQQAYNTVGVIPTGNTGTCTSAPCIDFSGTVGYAPFEGLVSAATSNDPVPSDPPNQVAKYVKGPSSKPWAGASIYTNAADQSVATIGLSVSKIITLRVYSEAAGQTMRLKVENAANSLVSIETDAVTTKAGAWETLSFDMGNPAAGTPAYDPCQVYNKVSLLPQFSTTAAPDHDTTTYVDELKYAADPGTTGGGSCIAQVDLVLGKFSSSYVAVGNGYSWQSAEGGDSFDYIDESVQTQLWWHGVAPPSDTAPANFYFGFGINKNAKPWGFGAGVKAPTNKVARVSPYNNFKIEVWGNPELMATKPTLTVLMTGSPVAGCSAVLQSTIAVQGTGAAAYTLPLSGFTLAVPCGYGSAAAALTGGVAQIDIQVLGNNVQYVNPAPGDPNNFPNGLNIGPMTFN